VEQARRWFDALKVGGRVVMAFEKTFWSPGYGALVDRFGIPWMVNTTQ
jgi:PhnB protein